MSNGEPKRLRKGKAFHKEIQEEWHSCAEGIVETEKTVTKPSEQEGRIDIFVDSYENLVAVVEVKTSDWYTMPPINIRRNVRRQANQIWDYIESQLRFGKAVSPGVIFPKRPRDPDRMKLIEHLFSKKGIAVVWKDETIAERKARS